MQIKELGAGRDQSDLAGRKAEGRREEEGKDPVIGSGAQRWEPGQHQKRQAWRSGTCWIDYEKYSSRMDDLMARIEGKDQRSPL